MVYEGRKDLEYFLLNSTCVGDLCIIQKGTKYIGCTLIDRQEEFIESLSDEILNKEVENSYYSHWNIGGISAPCRIIGVK